MVLESNTYIDISPYHEILSGMNFILSISVGVVKLTGPEGTGKTRLLQQLETELQGERQETLLFLDPPTSIKDLHDTISRKLRLDNEFGFNKALIHHIIAKPYDQQRLVVVFDDAEKIDMDVLLAIALFRNIMHNGQPIVSIVLCGNEDLNDKLEDASYRPLVQDMLLSYELNPLTLQQVQAYGKASADIHRLGQLPLKNGVLAKLLADSQGLPGAVPDLLEKLRDEVAAALPPPKLEIVVPVADKPAPKPVAAAKPAFKLFGSKPADKPKPAPESKLAANPEPVSAPVLAPAPKLTIVASEPQNDVSTLSPDEQLILASRAEKESGAGKFAVNVDWQRWKPAMQGTAIAAGLLVVVAVGWPRVAPMVSNLYISLTREEPQPPVQVAVTEPVAAETAPVEPAVQEPVVAEPVPEQVVAEAPAEPAPAPVVAATVAETTPEPVAAEPEPVIDPPVVEEPLVATAPEPAPAQVATASPTPAAATPAAAAPAVRI